MLSLNLIVKRNQKMKRTIACLVLLILLFLEAGCNGHYGSIEFISLAYPDGETRLSVWKNGEATLSYGALFGKEIRNGTFHTEDLYKQLQPRLHRNTPRENWPDPKAEHGMVQVRFEDGKERDYLIFNEQVFAEKLFSKARENMIGKTP